MMDVADVSRIVRDLIVTGLFPCTLVFVQNAGHVWRITVRDDRQCLVSFDVATGLHPAQVRAAIQEHLESQW